MNIFSWFPFVLLDDESSFHIEALGRSNTSLFRLFIYFLIHECASKFLIFNFIPEIGRFPINEKKITLTSVHRISFTQIAKLSFITIYIKHLSNFDPIEECSSSVLIDENKKPVVDSIEVEDRILMVTTKCDSLDEMKRSYVKLMLENSWRSYFTRSCNENVGLVD